MDAERRGVVSVGGTEGGWVGREEVSLERTDFEVRDERIVATLRVLSAFNAATEDAGQLGSW